MNIESNKGVTLIGLTITIIVLLILASITTYSGLNTIKSSKLIKFEQELEIMQAEVNLLNEKYKEDLENNIEINIGKEIPAEKQEQAKIAFDECGVVETTGYKLFDAEVINALNIEGIEREYLVNISKKDVICLEGLEIDGVIYYNLEDITEKNKIKDTLDRGEVSFSAVVNDMKIQLSDIKFSKYVGKGKIQYKLDGTDNWTTLETDFRGDNYSIDVKSPGTYIIRITDAAGIFAEKKYAIIKPSEDAIADSTVSFSTNYGRIDVIWLDGTTNTIVTTPNAPILTSNNESLTPVKWNDSNQVLETTEVDTEWYKYKQGSGTEDNIESRWANAKTANDSYFVWIPRYAYRITYYESETSTEPTGYYDGYGMWSAVDGSIKYKIENEIEIVEYNGDKYIVHPAFNNNLDYGGWLDKLSGFWVAKFEMSGTGNSLTSTYGVQSTREQTIGEQYTSARQATYGYTGVTDQDGNTSFMYSHMMKNSEWGAVVYLTHSQYGRNGKKIEQNTEETYYTGGLPGNTGYITNVDQSTTGNVYGVYDISGGAWERVACFNSEDSNSFLSNYGWTTATGLTVDSSSTKYATKYNNDTSNASGTHIYIIGKTGDSTKEVYIGSDTKKAWFGGESYFTHYGYPFFVRGDDNDSNKATVFTSWGDNGDDTEHIGFRVVLCP